MKKTEEFPRLDLFFKDEGGKRFLVDALFRLDKTSRANRKLIMDFPRGNSFRAFCILLLLAKYQDENEANPDEELFFGETKKQASWLTTLGTSFGKATQQNFFYEFFGDVRFVAASRGSTQNGGEALPSAIYRPLRLRLHNLHLFKVARSGPANPVPLTGIELVAMAEKLEKREVEKKDGWKPAVREMAARIDAGRPLKAAGKVERTAQKIGDDSSAFTLTARWREFGDALRKQIEDEKKDGCWYVVCITPSWLESWKNVFRDAAINHQAKIKFAVHAPNAAKKCSSVRAQWQMNYRGFARKGRGGADYVEEELPKLWRELASWSDEVRTNARPSNKLRGSLELYESYITHPFMAVLYVPSSGRKAAGPTWGAPDGTWCLLSLYPLYPEGLEERCGLYLNGPSPMLDIYYKSICKFFEQGEKDGYLKPFKGRKA